MNIREFDNNRFFKNIIKHRARDKLEEFRQYTSEIESKFNSDKNKLSSSDVVNLFITPQLRRL